MLSIPEKGFLRSVETNNVSLGNLADWIEANLLFSTGKISISDIVDLLIEEQICNGGGQELAHEIANSGWLEIEKRKRWGGIPEEVIVEGLHIRTTVSWEQHSIRSFL